MSTIKFRHSGARSDIIYSLPAIIALSVDGEAVLYVNTQPVPRQLNPKHVFTIKDVDCFRELLIKEDYISDVQPWVDERIDFNLDMFRLFPGRSVAEAHLNVFNANFDLTKPWLSQVEPTYVSDIVIQKSIRWNDREDLEWRLLLDYKNRCVFLGSRYEYDVFTRKTNVEVKHLRPKTYLELASIIRGSKLLVGNQSFGFALAEAMKHPRVLEVYYAMPDSLPYGPDAYTQLSRETIEKCLEKSR
jgi:hypothetical protein